MTEEPAPGGRASGWRRPAELALIAGLRPAELALIAAFVGVYLLPLGCHPLIVPDEARYGSISAAMLDSGDWVVPRLAGVRYFEKPVLGYWLNAAALGALGESRFALRLSSALATGATGLLVYLLAFRVTRRRNPAVLAAGVYLGSALVFGLGSTATLDGVLCLWLSAALGAFWVASERPPPRDRPVWLALAGAACGLAFLTKGLLAFVVPGIVVAPFLLLGGRFRDLLRMPWIPLAVALAVALPWSLAVAMREPDYWRYFVMVEHLGRFTGTETAFHPEPFWALVPSLLVGALPWTPLIPAAVSGLLLSRDADPGRRFLWLWLAMPFLFFSASSGKLATYLLPCFPPLAILLAIGLDAALRAGRRRLFDAGAWVAAGLLGVAAIALAVIQLVGFGFRPYSASESATWITLVLVCALGVCLFARAARRSPAGEKLALVGAWCGVALFVAHFAFPARLEGSNTPERFLRAQAQWVSPDAVLVTDVALAHAISWIYRRDDAFFVNHGELRYGLGYPDATGRYVDHDGVRALLESAKGKRPVVLFDRSRRGDRFDDLLPANTISRSLGRIHLKIVPAQDPADSR